MKWVLLLLLNSFLGQAFAQDCPQPNELNDVLSCLREKHRIVLHQKMEADSLQRLGEAQGQLPNPELDIQSVYATNGASQTQITLTQELDLGTRRALRKQGEITHQIRLKEVAMTKENITEEVLLRFHHLFHIKETKKVNDEIVHSLTKVVNSLGKRPALTPEQEASLATFRMQLADATIQSAFLEDAQAEEVTFFSANGGYKVDNILSIIHDHDFTSELKSAHTSPSIQLQQLALEKQFALAELQFEKAKLWDGIKVGPMFLDEQLDEIRQDLLGFQLTVPLPFWHINGAAKSVAIGKSTATEKTFSLLKNYEDQQRESLKSRLQTLLDRLTKLPSKENLSKSHSSIENLYSRGMVSTPAFIESHRSWKEVTQSKLELEEQILKLNISYHRLNGDLHEINL